MQPENKTYRLVNKIEEINKVRSVAPTAILPDDLKIKVLVLADSPTVVTGFGNVCREILGALQRQGVFSFDIVGINHDGSPHGLPYRIWPAVNPLMPDMAYREVFGRQQFLDRLGSGIYDIVWVLQDTFVVSPLGQKIVETNEALPADRKFTFMYYYPIDATPRKDWIDGSVFLADLPVAYTKYALDETLKIYHVDDDSLLDEKEQKENKDRYREIEGKLNVIYHGVNVTDFKPLPDEEVQQARKHFWGEDKMDKFVFINVNRNQPRKDIYRTLVAFKKLLDRRRAKGKDDVYLYTHCSIVDTGLNLVDMSKQIGLVQGDEWAFPDPNMFSTSAGVPIDMLNKLYNASDAVITTTLGEGWGLSITEGMACKKPVIAPDHTSISEMLGKTPGGGAERGMLVKLGDTFVQHDDNSRVRHFVDVEDMVNKMEEIVENRAKYQPMVERAYSWAQDLKWDGNLVGAKWLQLFESAYQMTVERRVHACDLELEQVEKENKPAWLIEKERREKNRNGKK